MKTLQKIIYFIIGLFTWISIIFLSGMALKFAVMLFKYGYNYF